MIRVKKIAHAIYEMADVDKQTEYYTEVLGLKAGVDVDLMIKAIATGSGGSTQFGIRAPWMAQRRFLPAQGTVPGLQHYFDMIGEFADSVGVATPMLDRAAELYEKFMDMGLGEQDGAAMVDVIGALPRRKA